LPDGGGEILLGRPRVHLRQIGSTNDRARELASAGAPHGTLVTASAQSAGRGRQGRVWSAPANSSLLMSLVLRSPTPLLALSAAVAVCEIAGDEAQIKWPNDIVLVRAPTTAGIDVAPGDAGPGVPALAKLAGILIEGRPQEGWAVLGIGLNVAVQLEQLPVELRSGAATLGRSSNAIEPTLELLLTALQRRLAEPAAATLDAWRSRDALHGREIAWASGRGRAAGIDDTGRLIVSLAAGDAGGGGCGGGDSDGGGDDGGGGGQIALDAGEVHLRPVD
jgi:BirA family transcriptional regulator, biotin operon repressor / biotin---[acetyl-CoA-carboxylase] ligase